MADLAPEEICSGSPEPHRIQTQLFLLVVVILGVVTSSPLPLLLIRLFSPLRPLAPTPPMCAFANSPRQNLFVGVGLLVGRAGLLKDDEVAVATFGPFCTSYLDQEGHDRLHL